MPKIENTGEDDEVIIEQAEESIEVVKEVTEEDEVIEVVKEDEVIEVVEKDEVIETVKEIT